MGLGLATAVAPAPGTGAPACVAEACQPRVAVPGHEPTVEIRGRRTELVLSLLSRLDFEPLTSIAWAIASSGVRLDYAPRSFAGESADARRGWGQLQVWLKFRLDAENAPVLLTRPGRASGEVLR